MPRTNAQQRPADLSPYLSKLALIAIPRAGISLLGPIAQRYGWIGHYLPDTTAAPTGRARIDVTRMAEMLPPGTFLAGPIRHDEATTASLTTFRKILLVRDLRSILVSRLALERRLKRHASLAPVWQQKDLVGQMSLFLSKFGPVLFDEILSILPWLTEPGIIAWRFEEMLTPGDQLARMIATTLRRDFNPPRDVLRLDIMSRRSANRRHFADYWSNEAEKTFTAFGGPQMNRLLGYERES
ncbi:MAG TPA: hypothetical protein VF920_06405 [Dongiaceae bacterium]